MAGTRKRKPLGTAKAVENVADPGRYSIIGEPNLYFQVGVPTKNSRRGIPKSWLFRFMRNTLSKNGKKISREMGLGPYPTITLAHACKRALEQRRLLADGIDPIDARDAAKRGQASAAARSKAFRERAEEFIAANRASWKNEKHGDQWENTLATYAFPIIGDMPCASIRTSHVRDVLMQPVGDEREPLWTARAETASRLRGRIEAVLGAAIVAEERNDLNPARWKDNLAALLPKPSELAPVEHHPALPYVKIAGFVKALRKQEGIAPRGLEFLILTGTRTGDVIKATWRDVDLEARVWTIPAAKRKGRRKLDIPHRVPLSDRALEILAQAKGVEAKGEHVFPGYYEGEPLSNMAMLKALERMNYDGDDVKRERPKYVDKDGRAITVHGFRSSLRDWIAERTHFPNHVGELVLAHKVKGVEGDYRRGDMLEQRRELMDQWAQYVETGEKAAATVTPIRAAKK
jgi:integrase